MMAGRREQPVEADAPFALTQLAKLFRELRTSQGNPSLRELAGLSGCSHSTLSRALGARLTPTKPLLETLIAVLDPSPEEERALWHLWEMSASPYSVPSVVERAAMELVRTIASDPEVTGERPDRVRFEVRLGGTEGMRTADRLARLLEQLPSSRHRAYAWVIPAVRSYSAPRVNPRLLRDRIKQLLEVLPADDEYAELKMQLLAASQRLVAEGPNAPQGAYTKDTLISVLDSGVHQDRSGSDSPPPGRPELSVYEIVESGRGIVLPEPGGPPGSATVRALETLESLENGQIRRSS